MLSDALGALRQVLSPPFRRVLAKTLGLTLAVLVALGVGLWSLLAWCVVLPWDWAQTVLEAAAGLGIAIGLVFLVAPVASLVAGLFLDEIAEIVEREVFPGDPPGTDLPLLASAAVSLRFFAVVLLANVLALALLLVPGINLVVFFLANGYLLGREYFEFAAMRHHSRQQARALRRAYGGKVFAAGLIVAGLVAIPVVNLLTPLFAAAFMVRLHRRLAPPHARAQAVLPG